MNILTDSDLQKLVPAAFAEEPASHVSERYSFLPTLDVVNQLRERGWQPVRAVQSRRVKDTAHAKHMITFRHSFVGLEVNDLVPEVLLINSHDTTNRRKLLAGIFRLVCSNGMVVSIGQTTTISTIHKDNAHELDIFKMLSPVLTRLSEADKQVQVWHKTELDLVQQLHFANEAIVIRNQGNRVWSKHFDGHNFLARRRAADKGNDLWTVFNVVQENVVKGGVRGASGYTRAITQVSENVRINTELWQLAETTASGLN